MDSSASGPAWSHNWRTDATGSAVDLTNAKNILNAINSNSAANNPPYTFIVSCDKGNSVVCKGGKTIAFTKAEAQKDDATPRVMHICPLFLKDGTKETQHDLSSREFAKPGKRDKPLT